MSIAEALNTNPNTLLVISAADLKEFALELMDECNNSSKSGNRSDKYLTITETEKSMVSVKLRCGVGQKMAISLK